MMDKCSRCKAGAELLLGLKNLNILTMIHSDSEMPCDLDEYQEVVENIWREYFIEFFIYYLKKYPCYSMYDFAVLASKKKIYEIIVTVKRHLMSKTASESDFDTIARGNESDGVVKILFNLYINRSLEELVRLWPVSYSMHPKYVRKIGTMVEVTDREDLHHMFSRILYCTSSEYLLVRGLRTNNIGKSSLRIEEGILNVKYLLLEKLVNHLLYLFQEYVLSSLLRGCESCGISLVDRICSSCKLSSRMMRLVENN